MAKKKTTKKKQAKKALTANERLLRKVRKQGRLTDNINDKCRDLLDAVVKYNLFEYEEEGSDFENFYNAIDWLWWHMEERKTEN